MFIYLLIAAGGALGSVMRHWLSATVAARLDGPFPWGTLLVNVSGCLLIGFLASLSGPGWKQLTSPEGRAFFMIGLCGGYTTFSAFSLQTLNLLRAGDWPRASGYVVASFGICLSATFLGLWLATAVTPTR